MTVFYFVRHGETSWKSEEILNTHAKLKNHAPLTQLGIKQLNKTANDPRLIDTELILSSPYTRALQSAAILSRKLDKDLVVEYNLHEWLLDKNFKKKSVKEVYDIIDDFYESKGIYNGELEPVWESSNSIRYRVEKVLQKYKKYKKIIIVCHQMIIKIITEGYNITKEEIEFGKIVEYKTD